MITTTRDVDVDSPTSETMRGIRYSLYFVYLVYFYESFPLVLTPRDDHFTKEIPWPKGACRVKNQRGMHASGLVSGGVYNSFVSREKHFGHTFR